MGHLTKKIFQLSTFTEFMNYNKTTPLSQACDKINVIIEIPMLSGPVKYEFDNKSKIMKVDRFLGAHMQYPINYGFIPNTLSGDGDTLDALVYSHYPIAMQSMIQVRAIGVLQTQDEKGKDDKILCVPISTIDEQYRGIVNYNQLPSNVISDIEHFFYRYKELENNKWVNVVGWQNRNFACQSVLAAYRKYNTTLNISK